MSSSSGGRARPAVRRSSTDDGRSFAALAAERSGQQLTAVDAVDTAEPEALTRPRSSAAA